MNHLYRITVQSDVDVWVDAANDKEARTKLDSMWRNGEITQSMMRGQHMAKVDWANEKELKEELAKK